ncbi:restriction endonuclease subunit S [Lactococcus cremoris]|uniref:restriction endonuclease subunit S n=2 Tax=Lactococcus TaxID=1357 RepID=UPI00300DDF73
MAKIDDSVKKKVPELRFKGFTDEWEERKFADFIDVKSGKDYKHLNSGSIPVYGTGGYMLSVDRALSDIDAIGIGRKGTIDKPYLLKAPFWTVDTLFYAVPKQNIDLQFSLSIFKKINWKKFDESTGVPSLSKTVINSVSVSVPSYEEQQKIGSFFKQLDDTIALHQRKLDLLKEQKKGFLQKMFPKNGAKVPELRFAGFADDWEQRKFKDIIEKLTGGASIKPSDYLEEGIRTIPKGAVNSTGLADLSGSKYISEEFYESNKSSHVSTNNLVTSLRDLVPSAPNMGRIVRIAGEDEDFLMPQGVYKLELFDGMDEEFLIAFSNSDKYRKIISSEKNGSTQVHIRNGEFLNIDIELPFSEEQKQIGSFFKQLDNSIALHQHKLDLLKEQKKGFLQKMFV